MFTPLSSYPNRFSSLFNYLVVSSLAIILFSLSPIQAQMLTQNNVSSIPTTQNTGKKPMSKLWKNDGKWFAVMPSSGGAFIWRLDGTEWTQLAQISTDDEIFADVKSFEDTVHILMFNDDDNDVDLASLQYDGGSQTYIPWTERASNTFISLSNGNQNQVQAPTIDIDSEGRMWMGYKYQTDIEVRYNDHPYSSWSNGITIETNVHNKDISCTVAFTDNGGSKIGLMWSNQIDERFGFSYHVDGTAPNVWSTNEVPGDADALNVGGGMADDHINMAVSSNGTLFAAVKTSYDTNGFPTLGLLVRRANGTWDSFYEIDDKGTKPIIMLNEDLGELLMVYTYPSQLKEIVYRTIDTTSLSTPGARTLMIGGNGHGFSSGTKNIWSGEAAVIVHDDNNDQADGVLMIDGSTSFPISLMEFGLESQGRGVELNWLTAWETNSSQFSIQRSPNGEDFTTLGEVDALGYSVEPSQYNWIDPSPEFGYNYYRLKMEDLDGTFTYSNILSYRFLPTAITNSLVIAPNPVKRHFEILMADESIINSEYLTIEIFNTMGELVSRPEPEVLPSSVSVQLDAQLPDGVYMVRINSNGKSYSARFMKNGN